MKTSRLLVNAASTKVIPVTTTTFFATRVLTQIPNTFPSRQRQLLSCSVKYENDENLYTNDVLDASPNDVQDDQVKEVGSKHTCDAHTTMNSSNRNNTINLLEPGDQGDSLLDTVTDTNVNRFPCGRNHHEDELDSLPDPLPEPTYSVHKRVLPNALTSFSSAKGRKLLMEALFIDGTAESYWNLTSHFINQSDPAFCGITTLVMCLNALCMDPNVRWRGGWRYYGSEEMLLDRCCLSTERIKRSGITLDDFCQLGRCQGLQIELKRPTSMARDDHDDLSGNSNGFSLKEFRDDTQRILSDKVHRPLLVVSFSRQALGQTGDGHFSTIAAYHQQTDQVLVLDVARFKYTPYWVSVEDLYRSMQELDSVTNKPRGWFLLYPPKNHACQHITKEDRRPVEVVPTMGQKDICPVGDIRKRYCKANNDVVVGD
jgi:glutathione gamma-glutamylcysteinyltransferase